MKNSFLVLFLLAQLMFLPSEVYAAAKTIVGTKTTVNQTFTNPYSGETLTVNGEYYINDKAYFGNEAINMALGNEYDQLWMLESLSGEQMFGEVEYYLTSSGDDINLLASSKYILGDIVIAPSEGNDIVWSNSGNDWLLGGSGDDILDGGPGNDYISGDEGNDRLQGGAGDDTYFYESGDGNDVIAETSGFDTLEFGDDITLEDLTFEQIAEDLLISILGEGKISVLDFYNDLTDLALEEILFSDGSEYSMENLVAQTVPEPSTMLLLGFGVLGIAGVCRKSNPRLIQPIN